MGNDNHVVVSHKLCSFQGCVRYVRNEPHNVKSDTFSKSGLEKLSGKSAKM
jgi:hypothetical protein